MLASNPPTLMPLPFADSGAKNSIPKVPGTARGLASLQSGFPAETMLPIAGNGVPPSGQDINGILNLISQTTRWTQAGGGFKYDANFANDSGVGGYPAGAVLQRADGAGFWLNLTDNNKTNPDGQDAANWAPLEAYGIAPVTGLTNQNVTLTPGQYGLPIIVLSGALTGNVQILFPALTAQWLVVNSTTGDFAVAAKTASGSGVIVAQGGSAQVWGDGKNLNRVGIDPVLFAPIDSPKLTGTPTAPTPAAGDNSTQIATTAFVQAISGNYATQQWVKGYAVSKAGDTMTGPLTLSSTTTWSPLVLSAKGYAPRIQANNSSQTIDIVNAANNTANLSVFDGGQVSTRGNLTVGGATYAGGNNATIAPDGNVWGTMWGGWLRAWLDSNIGSKAPIRQNNGGYGYVINDSANVITQNWNNRDRINVYIDGHYQGDMAYIGDVNAKANAGANCQWQGNLVKVGPVAGFGEVPNGLVVTGVTASSGESTANAIYMYARTLRNQ
ncbi:MAG: hypothetical protein VB141_11650 [Burkholderia gladioli]